MKGEPFPLARGWKIARFIESQLAPYAQQIAIAGSIRRQRPMVGDIDLVILPLDQEAILHRLKEKCLIDTGDSPTAQNTIAHMADGTQVDIFFARPASRDLFAPIPGNWGSLLLCRTGSQRHNVGLCQRAKDRGLHYDPYRGLLQGGQIIASETEEEIYMALEMPWLNPETERESLPAGFPSAAIPG